MSRDRFKARERTTQKMTRDGLVERNESTGDEIHVSKRNADFDLRGQATGGTSYSQLGSSLDSPADKRKRYDKAYQQFQQPQAPDAHQPMESQADNVAHPLRFQESTPVRNDTPDHPVAQPPQKSGNSKYKLRGDSSYRHNNEIGLHQNRPDALQHARPVDGLAENSQDI